MNVCGIISVAVTADATELAGAVNGQVWYFAARAQVDQASAGICAIDFGGIRLATVSWLREGVIALIRYARVMRPDIVLVAANLAQLVREELQLALEATGEVCVDVGTLGGETVAPAVLGKLDPALRETLKAVEGATEFDASAVRRSIPDLALSAANNRLAALEMKGVLTSERRGRTRIYRPLLEKLRYGH